MYRNQPKVSVIIPAYNIECYLEECLDSVGEQTYPNLDIIIINDGSKDSTGKIANKWAEGKENVRVIHTENQGISKTRNLGLNEAKGDFIIFIDSDDCVTKYHIEEFVEIFLKEMPDVVGRYTRNRNNLDQASLQNYEVIDPKIFLQNIFEHRVQNQIDISIWGKLYPKEKFAEVRFPGDLIYEDQAANYEILSKVERIAVSNSVSYYYRDTPDSIMNEQISERFLDSLKISELIKKSLAESGKFSEDEIIRYSNRVVFTQYIRTLGNRDESKSWIGDQLFSVYRKNIRQIRVKTLKEKLINLSLYSRRLFNYLLIRRIRL